MKTIITLSIIAYLFITILFLCFKLSEKPIQEPNHVTFQKEYADTIPVK